MMAHIGIRLSMLALAFNLLAPMQRAWAAPPNVEVQLNVAGAQPRAVEEATQASILRDYKTAWQNLGTAMLENRQDLIDASFAGFAHDKLTKAIADQKRDGLKRRYIDHGHKVEAVFYSYDGSAMQLKDTANVEVQLMDGDKVVASQPATIFYVVLITPAENSWKIRDLQAVPSF
jgi:hypothetical protein